MKKKRQSPGLSRLVAEMTQAMADNGTQWTLHLCNGTMKEGWLHTRGLEVKCGITNLQRERGSNGVWILQKN